MIEISHRQARVLIREGIDRPLPDEQWSALHAHLETCEECRAFQRAYLAEEKGIRRTFQHRWSSARGPVSNVWEAFVRRRKSRMLMRLWLKRGAVGFGVFALLFLWLSWLRTQSTTEADRLAQETQVSAANISAATLTPTQTITFRGVIAFSRVRDGLAKTTLLTSGGGRSGISTVDLIEGSRGSNDAPAWSPDGEWVAFLSDDKDAANPAGQNAPTGGPAKAELHVVHISGSHRTQLTDSPNIEWRGPLSWSSDGQSIALTGKRIDQGGSDWIYLASIDGSGARPLVHSRGVRGPARFSPNIPMLAFTDSYGNLMVSNIESGYIGLVESNSTQTAQKPDALSMDYDWSPGGHALVYIAKRTLGQSVILSPDINPTYRTSLTQGQEFDSSFDPDGMRSVSWVPNNLLVATLIQSEGGCWIVRLRNPYSKDQVSRSLSGLCIEGHLGPEHWTSDGDWLVAWARTPAEMKAGIPPAPYALRIPSDLSIKSEVHFEKLTDQISVSAMGDFNTLPDLAVRPSGSQQIGLNPRAAPAHQPPLPASRPDRSMGSLIFTSTQQNKIILKTASIDGTGARPIIRNNPSSSGGNLSAYCPAVSPDGARLAFVAQGEADRSLRQTMMSVMLSDIDGGHERILFDLRMAPEATSPGVFRTFECPVWSPDGKFIISVLRNGSSSWLAVAPTASSGMEGGEATTSPAGAAASYAATRFLRIGNVSNMAQPRWVPDGRRVLLVYPDSSGGNPATVRIAALDPFQEIGDNVDAVLEDVKTFQGWTDIGGLEYSPDRSEAALILIYSNANFGSQRSFAQLTVVRSDHWDMVSAPTYDIDTPGGDEILHWLPDGRVTFISQAAATDRNRAYLLVYNPMTLRTDTILAFQDFIGNMAWSPDGRWAAFTAESGLWVLDAAGIMAGESLSPWLVASDADWQVVWK